MPTCPLCSSTDPDVVELLDSGLGYCAGCDRGFPVQQPPRLIDPPPTTEQRRRDLQ